jgi:hypothetical protein
MRKISRSKYLDRRVELHSNIVEIREQRIQRVEPLVFNGSLAQQELEDAKLDLCHAQLDLLQATYERDSETYPEVNK